jgi:hypothetical protein
MAKQRDGGGVLFQNADKKHEKAPDYKGTLILDQDYGKGTEIKLAGWRKSTPRGHLISIAVDNYRANPDNQYPKPVVIDDDVPF